MSQIQNKILSDLVAHSEAIQSLSKQELLTFIDQIAQLPEEGQKALIKLLQEEQLGLSKIEKSKQAFLQKNLRQINSVKKKIDKDVRKAEEKDNVDEAKQAEIELLNSL